MIENQKVIMTRVVDVGYFVVYYDSGSYFS